MPNSHFENIVAKNEIINSSEFDFNSNPSVENSREKRRPGSYSME